MGEIGFWWGFFASFHQSSSYFCLLVGNFSLSWYKMISRKMCQIMVIMIQVPLHFNFLRLFIQQLWEQVGKNLECRKASSYLVVVLHIRGC